METVTSILNAVFWGLPFFIVALCVLIGAKKGLALSIVKLIRIAVSIGLALLVTRILISSAHETIQSSAVGLVEGQEEVTQIINSAPSLLNYVTVLVSYLLAPIVFLPVYLVVTLVMLIPNGIVKHIIKKKNKTKHSSDKYRKTAPVSWLWGMLLGLVSGVMITAAILMPFANYVKKGSDYVTKFESSGIDISSDSGEDTVEALRAINEHPGVQVFATISSPLFDALTTYETTEKVKVSVFKDLDFVLEVIPDFEDLSENMKGLNADNFDEINLQPLKSIINKLKNTGNLKSVVVEIMSTAGNNWSAGDEFFGVNMSTTIPSEFLPYANIAFGKLAEMSVEDVDASLDIANGFVDAIGTFAKSIGKVKELMDTDFSDIPGISVTPIKAVSDILASEGNDLAREIVAKLLSDAGTAWKDGGEYMGLNIKDSLPDGYKNSLDSALELLADTTKDNVCAHLNTFADAIDSIKKTYVYVQSVINSETTIEQMQDNLTDVLTSLTPESVDLVAGAISEQMLTDLGMSDDTSAVIADTIGSMLRDVAELTPEEKEQEAQALNDIITYVSSGSAQTADPEDLVDSVLNSNVISGEIIRLAEDDEQNFEVSADEKEEIDKAIDDYILAKEDSGEELSEKETAILDALKSMFVPKTLQP